MDCRTFHRKLEDYLEGGLDFPARFGMERHARQCFACEKDVAEALSLRQMARGIQRVVAPADFETSLLARIRSEGTQRRFWTLRSLWLYGVEGRSWRVAGATVLTTVLIVGAVSYVYFGGGSDGLKAPRTSMGRLAPSPQEKETASAVSGQRLGIDAASVLPDASAASQRLRASAEGTSGIENLTARRMESDGPEYVEVLVPIAGGRHLVLRLPKTIRMRKEQPSGEYYIRNISY